MGVVNGFFRENLLLKKGASLCLSIMRSNKSFDKLSFLLMQTKEDVKEISKYVDNKSKISVAGFVKSDLSYGLVTGKEKEKILSEYYMTDKDTVLIAGATNFDEEIILNAYKKIKECVEQVKLIIVPRWSYRIKEVENLIKSKGLKFKRKSELSEPSEIILVDTDINLSKLYSIGTINILGRSFIPFEKAAQGGSNIFEAAIHGKPILFGTNMSSWKEHTTKILEKFPELQVIDEGDLAKKILLLLNDKRKYLQISRGIKTFADIELQKNQNLITGCVKKIKNMLL